MPTRMLALGLVLWTCAAAAAPPANDEFANARVLPPTGATHVPVDATEATAWSADPGCGAPVQQSLWFRYTSPVDQFVIAAAAPVGGSTAQRPRVSAWRATADGLVAADCHPEGHEADFHAAAGETYFLLVSSPAAPIGPLSFSLIPYGFVPWGPPAPPNNLFWKAQPVGALPWLHAVDLGAGMRDLGYDPHACNDTRRDYIPGDSIWYRYTAATDGWIDAKITTSMSYPYAAVFVGPLEALHYITCDERSPSDDGALRFAVKAGQTYKVVFGTGSDAAFSSPATVMFRQTPPPTGGSISAAPNVGLYRVVVTAPEIGTEVYTHLVVTASAACEQPIPVLRISATLKQGTKSFSGKGTLDCSGGAGTVTMDLSDANGFGEGPARLTVRGVDFDSNYNVVTSLPVRIVNTDPL